MQRGQVPRKFPITLEVFSMSKKSLYLSFRTKEDLIVAIVDSLQSIIRRRSSRRSCGTKHPGELLLPSPARNPSCK